MSAKGTGSRARGDSAYEAVYRVVKWASWEAAVKSHNANVGADRIQLLAKRYCRVTQAQVNLRLKLLVEDGVVSRSGYASNAYRFVAAQDWADQRIAETTKAEQEIEAEVKSMVAELGCSDWRVTVNHRRDVTFVQLGEYIGVPLGEAMLMLKMARRGALALLESAAKSLTPVNESEKYVLSFTEDELARLLNAVATTESDLRGHALYHKLMNAEPIERGH